MKQIKILNTLISGRFSTLKSFSTQNCQKIQDTKYKELSEEFKSYYIAASAYFGAVGGIFFMIGCPEESMPNPLLRFVLLTPAGMAGGIGALGVSKLSTLFPKTSIIMFAALYLIYKDSTLQNRMADEALENGLKSLDPSLRMSGSVIDYTGFYLNPNFSLLQRCRASFATRSYGMRSRHETVPCDIARRRMFDALYDNRLAQVKPRVDLAISKRNFFDRKPRQIFVENDISLEEGIYALSI